MFFFVVFCFATMCQRHMRLDDEAFGYLKRLASRALESSPLRLCVVGTSPQKHAFSSRGPARPLSGPVFLLVGGVPQPFFHWCRPHLTVLYDGRLAVTRQRLATGLAHTYLKASPVPGCVAAGHPQQVKCIIPGEHSGC